ncbi:P-loop containing nucleoside triphosphate hydrolase protein [Phlyctochytrium arcticum]|nr:P-loop containing nucleoside triphosphate hydrolase protein [Phlyctochytrium arcticum]
MTEAMDIDENEAPMRTVNKGKGKAVVMSNGKPDLSANLPWVEKYRPKNLDELISHQDIIGTITRFIDENRLPHLLLYGPPGTGKTSTILACARRLYGPRYKSMILELNASDERGIDVVRDQIKTFASTKKIFSSGFKLIILDEADAMTQVAQNALRRIIEKYTKNVRFCIICNYVGKIIPALQSRCTRFRFAPLKEDQIRTRLDYIIDSESVNITEDGRQALLKLSLGDMRRALNILQATHAAFNPVTEDAVYLCTGAPLPSDINQICDWLFNSDFASAYTNIQQLRITKGLALADIITQIHELLAAMELPPPVRVLILDKMAEIEYNLSTGCSEKIQLGALVGTFRLGCDLTAKLSAQ